MSPFALLLLLFTLVVCDLQFYNDCNRTIYSSTVGPAGTLRTAVIQPQSWHSESYYIYPWNGSGISIKLAADDGSVAAMTQLEYSFRNGTICYDLSNVNCGATSQTNTSDCPFLYGGMYLTGNDSSCSSVFCASGDRYCHQAFNLSNDTWATHSCEYNYQRLTFYMCPQGASC